VYILSPVNVSQSLKNGVYHKRPRLVHTSTCKCLAVSDKWRYSSCGLDVYILASVNVTQSLTNGVNNQMASVFTYFYL
jgi:hypothetical protein